jgi:nitrogen fixation NifU-like protein
MNPYGDVIHEHFRHPRNYGSLEVPDIREEGFNPLCGDRVRIELALGTGGVVSAARFQGDLCMIAKASASLLTEMIGGEPLETIEEFPERRLLDALEADIPAARLQCVRLPLEVLHAAVDSYRRSRRTE